MAWFLEQARARGLVDATTRLERPGHPGEVSAGGALVRGEGAGREVLVIRVRGAGYELPKGGVEWDELPEEAAVRETREEAGVAGELVVGGELGHLDYVREAADGEPRGKRVRYFALGATAPVLEALPARTRERRWLGRAELAGVPLVNEGLRALLAAALDAASG
jgi:ADP-ribose pyrophosphatase YjhB (NUDIX family)